MRELTAKSAKFKMNYFFFALFAFFAVSSLLITPAWGGIRIHKVSAGLDGYIRGERWLPVVFQVEGVGGNFSGAIEVGRGATTFRKSVDLSPGAKKKLSC